MKNLADCREEIHSCSKCGLCQSVCPIYKITGNDCTVSRGHFLMLMGLIKGDLKMSKKINKYLDLCLKCNACTKFCPSGIDVVNIITLAKAEYFKKNPIEKLKSMFEKFFLFGLGLNILNLIQINKIKSKKFNKKVLYFGGCGSKIGTNKHIIKVLNTLGIEVITPKFSCCGFHFLMKGDLDSFKEYENKFYKVISNFDTKEVITTCASCEKAIRLYSDKDITVKNIFDLLSEQEPIKLKEHQTVTFHKPCNNENIEEIKKVLSKIENMDYVEMNDYDKCCGFNGIFNFSEYKTLLKLFFEKRQNIINSGAKIVLTSCLGCKFALSLFSFGKYKVMDFTEFLAKNIAKK